MSFDIHLTYDLPAPPDKVIQLLTDQALIRRWSGQDAVLELKEGGKFEMFDGWATGKVLQATNSLLSYTWKTEDWGPETAESLVTYELKPSGKGTLVILSHTGLPDQQERDSHETGWSDFFFEPLEDYIMAFDNQA